MSWLHWGILVVLVVWVQREVLAGLAERRFGRRFAVNDVGVIIGAEARTYEGAGNRAVLLFHGYNDSPQSLDGVARKLQEAGWTVRLPLLPGHGRSLRAFDSWRAEELIAYARDEYAAMRSAYSVLAVGGLSMGGAVACWLAAEADPDAVVLYAPMLFVPRPMEVAVSTARLWSLFAKYVSGGGSGSIVDPGASRSVISYRTSSRRSLEALEQIATKSAPRLGFIHQPTLVIQSKGDNRLPYDQSRHAIARIGSDDKIVIWTEGAGHVVTLDRGWDELAYETVQWLNSRFPTGETID